MNIKESFKRPFLKNGLSGIMRAKNEAHFIEKCIDSCIDALDELIVVYNDCTDSTPEILARKQKQYPDKLKIYSYNHSVLSHNLTWEEFEYAINLPEDSVRLHSNQCNYALSKVSYKYAVKIDPDQIYFADEINKWRDVCNGKIQMKWRVGFVLGWFFMMYISFYRRVSVKLRHPCLQVIPDWLINVLKGHYREYIKWKFQKGQVAISCSGVNLFYDDTWYIPFDGYNIHPPYNGEGDHLIFRLSDKTFFIRHYNDKKPYTVIELFQHPYEVVVADTLFWFHLHANRAHCYDKVKKVRQENPDLFVLPEDFIRMSYKEVHDKMVPNAHTLYQRILFALVHKMGLRSVKAHIVLLENIKMIFEKK